MFHFLFVRCLPALVVAGALWAAPLHAQQPEFKVQLSRDVWNPGDTIEMVAQYKLADRQLPPASFALTLINRDSTLVWPMRWPLIDGVAEASFVLPANLPAGAYYLLMAVQPRFMALYMQVQYPPRLRVIRANIKAPGGFISEARETDGRGRFSIEKLMLEGDAVVELVNPESNDPALTPMASMDAWLDSAYQPAAYAVKQVVVPSATFLATPAPVDKAKFFATGFGCFTSTFAVQQQLRHMSNLSAMAQYDSLYVPAWLRGNATLTLNTFTDTSWKKYNTVYDWLEDRLKNIELVEEVVLQPDPQAKRNTRMPAAELVLQVRGENYRLLTDGRYGLADPLMRRPEEMAIIKIFAPPFGPFKGRTQGRVGCIAFFERRYPFVTKEPVRNTFQVRGYTPKPYLLPMPNQ